MVWVVLKGVHVVRRRLATGEVREYHYAWKGEGAPRLQGRPGSPSYISGYHEAHKARKRPDGRSLASLVAMFRASPDFTSLGAHTRRAYSRHLRDIEEHDTLKDLPTGALSDPGVRVHFYAWRDEMAATPRTADMAMGVLRRLLRWAVERGMIVADPLPDKLSRLHRADRSESIWTAGELARFLAVASKELGWAVRLAAFTGLRQGDLIRLAWGHYDGASFQMRTSKRGKVVTVPAVSACQALMGEIERRHLVVLTTERGKRPWTADGLRSSFGKACKIAEVERTFHDLRRTAATNLIMAGIETPQLAMIMGWEEEAVESLKRRYVSRSAVVASVLAMLEKGG